MKTNATSSNNDEKPDTEKYELSTEINKSICKPLSFKVIQNNKSISNQSTSDIPNNCNYIAFTKLYLFVPL